jgi:hypothetical protein
MRHASTRSCDTGFRRTRRHATAGCAAGLLVVLAVSACSSSGSNALLPGGPTSHTSGSASGGTSGGSTSGGGGGTNANGGSYATSAAVVTALAKAGFPCNGAQTPPGAALEKGEIDVLDCSLTSSGDTAIAVYDDNADLTSAVNSLIPGIEKTGLSAQLVLGENWMVNSAAPNGVKVQHLLGGRLVNVTASASASDGASSQF